MAVRDMGWLLCWVTTPQEALEHVLIGYRIAEDKKVRMPMGLAMDGAFLTHSQHMVKIPSPAKKIPPAVRPRRAPSIPTIRSPSRRRSTRTGSWAETPELGGRQTGARRDQGSIKNSTTSSAIATPRLTTSMNS